MPETSETQRAVGRRLAPWPSGAALAMALATATCVLAACRISPTPTAEPTSAPTSAPTAAATTAPTPVPPSPSALSQPSVLPLTISVTAAAVKLGEGAFLVDVREQAEWNDVHIPGTTLIPLAALPERLGELPKDRDVVVVCGLGARSQKGRDLLLQAGFTRVTSMAGGVSEWRAQGYPTVSGP